MPKTSTRTYNLRPEGGQMTDNLLDKDTDVVEIDPNKDYLVELVGDGKKFKSPEELAKGKYEADQYIEILKRRQDEMRADYLKISEENKTRASLEDLIKQMQQQPSNNEPEVKDEKPTFDSKQIESLVSTKIQEHETSKRQTDSFNLVRNKLQERYGNNYKTVVANQIEELGITETELNEMARKQPKVLIRTLGLDKEPVQEQFQTPPRSGQRSDTFKPRGQEKRTWAYYQNLKKTNPEAWFDRKTAVQMQQDAIDLGEAFKDGDYNAYGGQ